LLVSTYVAFGQAMFEQTGTVIDSLKQWGPSSFGPAVIAVQIILTAHLLTALPIVLSPICLFLERALINNHVVGTRSAKSVTVRTVAVAVVTLVSILLPYFLPLVSIISDISVVLVIYILPPVFYWKLITPSIQGKPRRYLTRLMMLFLICFGIAGSVLGLRAAIPSLISAIEKDGNPFDSFFSFDCPNVTQSIRNLTCF
jgi:hypothetical protein